MKVVELKQPPQADVVGDTEEFRKFAARIGVEILRPDRDAQGLVVRVPATGEVLYVQFDEIGRAHV